MELDERSAARLPIVRAGVPSRSELTVAVTAVDGRRLATLDIAPPLLATLTIGHLRTLAPLRQNPPASVFEEAGRHFAESDLDGLSPEDYCRRQALSAGVPIRVARHSLTEMAQACRRVGDRAAAEAPRGAATSIPPGAIEAMWLRKGDILGVIAPGNNPGVHLQWVLALALGYRLVIKPGTRDPFTPYRLVSALLRAGVEPSQLSLLPGGHATGDAVVEEADISLVFGGEDAAARYAADRHVVMRGPGRSKLLLNGPLTEDALQTICASVGYDAGMRCTNATAVFTESDPDEVAEAIAERLATLTPAPPLSPDAQLPVQARANAQAVRDFLDRHTAGAVDVAARHVPSPLADLGDGTAALRPAVLRCDRTDHPGAQVELPFPCVWVVPWQRAHGLAPLRDTLALTILHPDDQLAAEALARPRIRSVFVGSLPTFSAGATSPHDGYLGQDLMEARGFGVAPLAANLETSSLAPATPAPRSEARAA